jgi:uncharacterized protein YdiU (UPF0061 family)
MNRDDEEIRAAGWRFDNSYKRLPVIFYTETDPTPVKIPGLVIFNHDLTKELGLDSEALQSQEGVAVLAGNHLAEGASPIAQAYAGHQFGHFTMLGDGRAVLLGEHVTLAGHRLDIQLKGSGRTRYSRGGDGRAALGPMLREYLISEAMHGLGIPTTRSLAVVSTGEPVYRESPLPGAVLTRAAASHIRVGTFQFAARWAKHEELKALADYTWERHFKNAEAEDNRYLSLLREVVSRQAELIAKWQLVGFIHGVMNTDNMAVSGETIDYGPCAFMDAYDPATVFSSIDAQGRYAYGNQPAIAKWNLTRFAETLLPLISSEQEIAKQQAMNILEDFEPKFRSKWLSGMRGKLGLIGEETEDEHLIGNLLSMMKEKKADFTNTFRALTLEHYERLPMNGTAEFEAWKKRWAERLERNEAANRDSEKNKGTAGETSSAGDQKNMKAAVKELMRKNNPSVIPRNHRVEDALKAASEIGDLKPLQELLDALKDPFAYSPVQEEYSVVPEPSGCKYQTFCGT